MDHDIDVIYENPLLRRIALHMPRPVTLGLQTIEHAVCDGLDLTVDCAIADNEVIGGRAKLAEIDDDYIFGFLLQCEPATGTRKCLRC